MKTNKIPYIFIFDIDHTLIGKVSYVIEELHFIEYIQNVKNIKKEKSFMDFTKELEKGLDDENFHQPSHTVEYAGFVPFKLGG